MQVLDLLGPKTEADLEKPVKQKVCIYCVGFVGSQDRSWPGKACQTGLYLKMYCQSVSIINNISLSVISNIISQYT